MLKVKKQTTDFIVILTFLLVCSIFSWIFVKTGKMVLASDSSFHIARVEEIYQNLREGKIFTFVATHTFSSSGVGNFMFYPTIFLYPWALLRFIFNPVISFYLWYGGMLFLTMLIAYYSMLSYSNSRTRSYMFALIYSLNTYHIHLGIWNYVLGEFIAYTFLPLAFLGIYHILFGDNRKWYILGIGIALIMYSHLLSVYITTIILSVITVCVLFSKKGIAVQKILAILKSAVLAFLLVLPQLILFTTDYINQKLAAPQKAFNWPTSFSDFVDVSLDNTIGSNYSIGLIMILTMITGWYFSKEEIQEEIIYLVGVILACVSTKLIPWEILTKTIVFDFLGQIQFPHRFNSYSSFFLSITASLIFYRFINLNKKTYAKTLRISVAIIVLIIGYLGMASENILRIDNNNNKITRSQGLNQLPENVLVNKYDYNNIFSYLVLYGETDYYPKQSFDNNDINSNNNTKTIVAHEVYLNGRKTTAKLKKRSANNIVYRVKLTKNGNLDLPVLRYRNTRVSVNGQNVKTYTSERGTVQIKASKGINNVSIKYQPATIFYVGISISIITWIILVIMLAPNVVNRKLKESKMPSSLKSVK